MTINLQSELASELVKSVQLQGALPPDPPPGALPLEPTGGKAPRPPFSFALCAQHSTAAPVCPGPTNPNAASGNYDPHIHNHHAPVLRV